MHPGEMATSQPDKPAYIMAGSREVVTFGELEARANQGAHLFRSLGLERGDHIAIMLENHPRYLQICWAAQRAGLYYTPVSWRLQHEEVAYIVNNCEACVFIGSMAVAEVVRPLLEKTPKVSRYYMIDRTAGIGWLNSRSIPTYASELTNALLKKAGKTTAITSFDKAGFWLVPDRSAVTLLCLIRRLTILVCVPSILCGNTYPWRPSCTYR